MMVYGRVCTVRSVDDGLLQSVYSNECGWYDGLLQKDYSEECGWYDGLLQKVYSEECG